MSILEVRNSLQYWMDEEDKKLIVVQFYSLVYSLFSCANGYRSEECKEIAHSLNILARKCRHVIFLRLNVDNLKLEAKIYNISVLPTFLFFYCGKMEKRIETCDILLLEKEINGFLNNLGEKSDSANSGRIPFRYFYS